MTTNFDAALREAMQRLAATPAPQGMAVGAIRSAHRRRQVRTAVTLVAALAVAMAVVPVALGVSSGAGGMQTGQFQTMEPLVVTAYSGLREKDASSSGNADSPQPSLLLDPRTGKYVEVPYFNVMPSPDGTQILVQGGTDTLADPLRTGVLDRASMKVRWIEGYHGEASWSPDGREILMTVRSRLGRSGFAIIDGATLAVSFRDFDVYADTTGDFVWASNGKEIALTASKSGGNESSADAVTGIRFFDRTGKLVRTVPAAAPLKPGGFSPDGTRMALHANGTDDPIEVVDAATGPQDGNPLGHTVPLLTRGALVGWADNSHLLVRLWAEPGDPPELRVIDLAGNTTSTVQLLDRGVHADNIRIGSSDGLTPDAADLTF